MYWVHTPGLAVRGGGGSGHTQGIIERSLYLGGISLTNNKCHWYYYRTTSQPSLSVSLLNDRSTILKVSDVIVN